MMRSRLIALASLVALLIAVPARADTVMLNWTGDAAATSYVIEQRSEGSATWTAVPAAQVTMTCSSGLCMATVTGIAASGTIYFRESAVNAAGATTRYDAGAWYCGNCSPPSPPHAPKSIGVQ